MFLFKDFEVLKKNVYVHAKCMQVPREARAGHQSPWSRNDRWLVLSH